MKPLGRVQIRSWVTFVPRYCLSFTAEEGTKLMSSLEGNTSITLLTLIGHKYHSLVNLTLPLESANISPALYIPYLEANVDLLLGHCYCMNTVLVYTEPHSL